MSLIETLRDKRVVLLLGAGGVGKTTSSVAIALRAALAGRRVALLSIDPAQRLAAALGIPLGGEMRTVDLGPAAKGSLAAAMLDQKEVFDAMVRRHAPNPQVAFRILSHPIYQAASTKLIGPLEYMALAKLQDLAGDARYDLVVLDTPPDTHALDFLARPNVLSGFFENKVMTWLVKPFLVAGRFGLGRLLSAGERLMGGVAKVMGVTALTSLADFLVLVQDVIEGFHASGEKVLRILRSPQTSFLLVTVPTRASARSATFITQELRFLGYRLDAMVLNRCLPAAVAAAVAPEEAALNRRLASERAVTAELMRMVGPTVTVRRVEEVEGDMGALEGIKSLEFIEVK